MVKIGLSKAQYAKLGESEKASQIKDLPGLTSAKLELEMENENFYADDTIFAILESGITKLGLEYSLADISSEAKQDVLGIELKDGMELFKKDISAPYVATSFRSRLDNGKFVWFGLVKGKFAPSGLDLNTKEEKATAQTETISASFIAREIDGCMLVVAREDNEDFELGNFYKKVYGIDPTEVVTPPESGE
ncbi:major tail protein [Listeria innocua]|uniref:major tail protein n=1 Tax=Listeria innocua TaxID=1642 RepID=UPI00162A3511|nr:major tail protein [Listeria innocua]MBC2132067.1 phage tail protein [Listeria innocua]